MHKTLEYASSHSKQYIAELKDYLAIPSISSDPDYTDAMLKTAEFTKEQLLKAGCQIAEVHQTAGHPVVTGSWIVDESLPTVLVYGHYDVQPVDPIELWDKDPFKAHVRGNYIYARGAADDKGQILMHFKTLEAFKETSGKPPVNVKFLVEGEEEIASPSLPAFLRANRDLLSSDLILISDTSMWDIGKPAITYGLRGLAYLELFVTGPDRDLHSGEFGGAVANPAEVLARMISQVKDYKGRIVIPGFYDNVETVSDEERKALAQAPFDLAKYKQEQGVNDLWGEEGFSTVERTWIRPTFEVNGIWGGFTGVGAKTVLPSKAAAKVSCRLVPNQSPREIEDKLEDFFKSIAPPYITLEVKRHAGGNPVVAPIDTPYMQAALKGLEEAFDEKPLVLRGGGSIPIVADFKKILGLDSLLVGFCLPSARAHSPNENMHLPSFHTGIDSLIRIYSYLKDVK